MKGLILALMLVPSAQAQTQLVPLNFYQACFGGMDDYHNSARIDNCDFQYLVNILTDRGFLEKRPGSVRVFDSVLSGYPIKNFKEFITPANRKYLLIHSSQTIYSTDLLTISSITTTNVNAVMDSVSAFDKHFIVDGYDTPVYYDGTTTTSIPEMPVCKFVEFANERLLCANVAGAASTLYESGYADYTNWTIPIVESADAPTAFSFDAQDGQPLTGLFQSPFGTLAFKRSKMFIIRGVDGDDFEKKRLSDKVGCIDDRSIQLVDGCVQWLGVEGVYKWCGGATTPELVSRDIDTTVKAIRNITSNADNLTVTTDADFENGLFSTNGTRDAFTNLITADSIKPSSWTVIIGTTAEIPVGYEDFSDGNVTANPIWVIEGETPPLYITATNGYAEGATLAETLYTASTQAYGTWQFMHYMPTAASSKRLTISPMLIGLYGVSGSYQMQMTCDALDCHTTLTRYPGPSTVCTFTNALYVDTWGQWTITRTDAGLWSIQSPDSTLHTCVVDNTHTSSDYTSFILWPSLRIDDLKYVSASSGTFKSGVYDTTFETPVGGPFTISAPAGITFNYYVQESTSSNDGVWSSTISITNGDRVPLTKRYWKYWLDFVSSASTIPVHVDGPTLIASSTGTWDSEVINVGTLLTSWGQFNAITDTNDHLLFYTRASMTPYSVDSATPSWTVQGNGYNIACDTGTYLQARVASTIGSSTDTAQVLSLTFNWYEGEASQVASLFWDGRYYLSVSTGTEGTINNTVLVQQRNKKWTLFNGVNWSTLGIYDNAPYAGDGLTTSKIWRIIEEESYFDDNTKAINAEAITKDFQFDGQNNNKVFRKLYVESNPSVASTLSLGYSVDKSTTYYTTTQAIGLTPFNDEIKRFFPGFAKGQYLRLKFSNNTIYEPLMLNGYTLIGDIENLYRK